MSMWETALWWGVMSAGLIGSALYSGLETGAYRLNRVRLQIFEHQGRRSAHTLGRLLHQRVVLLSTLLIGNNTANYLGTVGLTVILQQWGWSDGKVILFNVLMITPLILVFGETLPKDLFAAYSDKLMYRFAAFLQGSRWLFTLTGILPLVVAFSHLLTRLLGGQRLNALHPRRQVHALVQEGVGHGVLSDAQSAIVERVLALSKLRVADEMVPWKRVIKVRVSDPQSVLWDLADRTSFSWFPMVDRSGQAVGLIRVRDALVHQPALCPPLRDLMTPVQSIDAATPLREALSMIQTQRLAMAIVTRQGKPVGIVTIKDLLEPITGELVSW